ncbi:unnamed protein product [Phytophthora fragariaefolia]|uniref:Unnamed protein product n=1 Tax=Phytophthora fragariaefolia TaxID=1490495 RepID=A0A9W6U1H0_9STRA|nr:unnamed protein product [Phytophthora fragariaefolia]
MDLRLKGLYGRGTVRGGSKHYPKHTILQKEESTRGDYQQSVASEHNVLAASWCDGSIVTMVTNADPSTTTTVTLRIGASNCQFLAPTCILNYNQHMQGVDRLDQIRARFSLADGHSYKRWHNKLALALIDIARANAYLTRRIAFDTSRDRDPHRTFLMELVSELISGRWKDAPSDGRMVFGCSVDREIDTTVMATPPIVHGDADTPYTCPQNTWTCWDKFHRFYLTKGLFSDRGNIQRSSTLAKNKAEHQSNLITATRLPAEGTTRQQSTPNQQHTTSQQHPLRQQSPPSQQSPSRQQSASRLQRTPRQQSPPIQQNKVVRQIFD